MMLGQLFCALGKAFGGCKPDIPLKPVTDLTTISRSEFLAEMAKVGIQPIDLGTPLDSVMSITSESEFERIAPYLVYPADWYLGDLQIDCEDYALQAQCDAAFKFHVSGVRLGLGWMPLGYHGFPVTLSKQGNVWLMEPNAGFPYAGKWFTIGANSYLPNKVLA